MVSLDGSETKANQKTVKPSKEVPFPLSLSLQAVITYFLLFFPSDSDRGPECWICYDPDRRDAGAMINPCNCRGDVGAVHHDCLRRWLVEVTDFKRESSLGGSERASSFSGKSLLFFHLLSAFHSILTRDLLCKWGKSLLWSFPLEEGKKCSNGIDAYALSRSLRQRFLSS